MSVMNELEELLTSFKNDGFDFRYNLDEDKLKIDIIKIDSEACNSCLIPKDHLKELIFDIVNNSNSPKKEIIINYPTDVQIT